MSKTCKDCSKYNTCSTREVFGSLSCNDGFIAKKQTNADKIRSMSDEELAKYNVYFISDDRFEGFETSNGNRFEIFYGEENTDIAKNKAIEYELNWLRSEVSE